MKFGRERHERKLFPNENDSGNNDLNALVYFYVFLYKKVKCSGSIAGHIAK